MGQKHRARRLDFPSKLGKRDDVHINMLTNRIFLERIVKQNLDTEIIYKCNLNDEKEPCTKQMK